MSSEHSLKKLKEFKKYVKNFLKHERSGIEEIHDLRTRCRELISLLSSKEELYKKIKKVIKASNNIRDVDVFFEEYLESLPKKYLKKLDMQSIMKDTKKSRKKELDKLHKYLNSLVIEGDIVLEEKVDKFIVIPKEEPQLNQEELHKYRIYIKKLLYREKNSVPLNKKRVNALSKIKDCLGSMNDNYNGFERLKNCELKPKLLERIENFTEAENVKLFKKFQISNRKYVGSSL
ncbi:CHAD domain-containing protein [bacterium]|nr:CHAD domain-containing protein [bacterium]MBU1435691.1 CHAD domain-containing protein [bacterium]MBU1502385.1 CHAD domain-containing protein [bacterium]